MGRAFAGPGDRPNVIVFFSDQQRWDCSALHGNPLELMPNFDRMAMRGTFLANSVTNHPVCGPARCALQTGRYGTSTTVFRNRLPLPGGERTLAHIFGEAEYQTGYIGKWHLGSRDPVPAGERGGYDYWLAANALEVTADAYRCVVFDGAEREVLLPGYRSDAITDAAIRYVDEHRRTPFFLFLSYIEPHHQNHVDDYPPPDGYRERYAGRWIPPDLAALGGTTHQHLGGYYGMVKRLDEGFGRLLDALKSLGLCDHTIVLFTSDHGSHFKTRNSEYKRSCHESSVRVPTAFCGPGFEGGGRVEELVGLMDLPPTLLEAAGLPVPPAMEGHSLVPLLRERGRAVPWQDDVYIQISESQTGRALRTRRWKYSVSDPGADGYTDIASARYVEEFLYDLQADPYELTNLAGVESHRELSRLLAARLLKHMRARGEPEAEIVPAPARPSGIRYVEEEELEAVR